MNQRMKKWLLLAAALLVSLGAGTVVSAAVPSPLRTSFRFYAQSRVVSFYETAARTGEPLKVSGDHLTLLVKKKKGKSYYCEYKDGSGWLALDAVLADPTYEKEDFTLKKSVKAYHQVNGRYLGRVPAKTEVGIVAREKGWVQAFYQYKGRYWMAWFKEKEFEKSLPKEDRRPKEELTETEPVSEAKVGNCDDYIGLSSKYWVLATAKRKVFVYSKMSTKSPAMGSFTKNNCIIVDTKEMKKGVDYPWLKVKMPGGKRGYIPTAWVVLDTLDVKTFGLSTSVPQNRTRIKVCQYGLPYIGTRFILGGNSLTGGIDCSTFARRAMRNAGIMVSAYALAVNLSNSGKAIRRNQLKPGDMVFYGHGSNIGHCAIYVGNGFLINASGHQGSIYPSGGIRFSKIDYRSPTAVKFRNLVGN